jgi:chromosome segregation ATPase
MQKQNQINKKVSNEISNIRTINHELREKNCVLIKENKSLQKKNAKFEEEIGELRAKVETFQDDVSQIYEENENLQEENKLIFEELNQANLKVEDLTEQLKQSDTKCRQLEQDNDRYNLLLFGPDDPSGKQVSESALQSSFEGDVSYQSHYQNGKKLIKSILSSAQTSISENQNTQESPKNGGSIHLANDAMVEDPLFQASLQSLRKKRKGFNF